jgi:hypothetical protein
MMNSAMNTLKTRQRPIMEHRWGERVTLDLPVRLELAGELLAHGRIHNASISGAWLTANTSFPAFAAVEVVLRTPAGRVALPACVVRRAQEGFAVEWRDMACEPLIAMLREASGEASLWRKDPAFGRCA